MSMDVAIKFGGPSKSEGVRPPGLPLDPPLRYILCTEMLCIHMHTHNNVFLFFGVGGPEMGGGPKPQTPGFAYT